MAMDLSSLGILVKDEQGNLQEKNLGEVLGTPPPMKTVILERPPRLARGETGSDRIQTVDSIVPPKAGLQNDKQKKDGLQNFRQQLSKVTGDVEYVIPSGIDHPQPPVSRCGQGGLLSKEGQAPPLSKGRQGGVSAMATPPPAVMLERPPRLARGETGSDSIQKRGSYRADAMSALQDDKRPHLTGPVQEIGSLSIDDLRHWNSKEQIVKHLTDEIGLLAKDSLAVRANGIRAWQKSPLHQLYLEIGRQSMVEDKPLGQVVEERARAGKPTLTLEQFEALMEANEQMRY